ncbi:RNA polymerase sigma-70 factor (ECF subfamily) [Antricoccus suffuscus]|uniref:RNA polymerase sigma-70 factor (ECF subfamily) n=1 Tax=Antricoccus suffuscus TaxID=1629062 RepID=A0A2T0ZXR8_9ACTN|nr:RNA polymerase sigma factor SigJ [Antricoccus suffuscus]PRZ41152.1 RNA polymerase sigma-70 factor (ECF subfamily) [Antricoccus suffuscus]
MTAIAQAHDDLRPLMFSIAYRMLGSVAEAEDVVQEAFFRMTRAETDGATPVNLDAWATTVTTRLAIDNLRSARVRREMYVGPWLPEPLVDGRGPMLPVAEPAAGPSEQVETRDDVSFAMLTLMETLTPVERAVFILREALGYDYPAIAEVVEASEVACRQHFSRARRYLESGRPRFEASAARREELAAAFLEAVRGGSLRELEALLADDVTFWGDGGGKAPAIQKPMQGALPVARFLLGLVRRGDPLGVSLVPAQANGQPAFLTLGPAGELYGVLALDIVDGRIVSLRNQINPDKLAHLGGVGDINSL